MAGKIELAFPGDVSSHDQFMYFRLIEQYKFAREKAEEKEVFCTIALPLPTNLTTAYASTYSNESLGVIGTAFAENAPEIAGIGNSLMQGNFTGAIDKLKDVSTKMAPGGAKGALGRLATYYMPELAIAAGGLFGSTIAGGAGAVPIGMAVNQAVKGTQAGLGVARNPYLAAVFEGIGFKSHQFSFQLTPKNAAESNTIRSIISAFRNASLPSDSSVKDFYDYPAQVQLAFHDPSYLFDIKTSVITAFDVNYHGKGAYYHDINGKKAPVEVTININFLETSVRLAGDEKNDEGKVQRGTTTTARANALVADTKENARQIQAAMAPGG
jgi:hypothetical protein